ncbi:hypothetical protein P154DRAFT_611636 [Amniculicola lignicola CBS 123094]|uniref:Uncharacterized protein n=1 Tax=Amniculicola lignicola CBS 123094 TaxID=1392246 RepID=A0A6A5WVZ5_9PLEO|nr:hypothetical protein P154DRAFT_611636 [Amniculicola lignicola CBS 123094]
MYRMRCQRAIYVLSRPDEGIVHGKNRVQRIRVCNIRSDALGPMYQPTLQSPPNEGATNIATNAPSELDFDESSVGGTPSTTDQDEDDDDAYDSIDWARLLDYHKPHPDGFYQADLSTTLIARHLAERKAGHSVDKNGRKSTSRVTTPTSQQSSLLAHIHYKGLRVSQGVVNLIAESFLRSRFLQSVLDWVVANNQALSVIEGAAFRAMLKQAHPLAEAEL